MTAGEALVLVGETRGELGASMYLRECLGREDGAPPPVDLAVERRNGDLVRSLIESGQVHVAHDLSDGGLIAAAVDMALASGVGVQLKPVEELAAHAWLFGEDQGRYLIATKGVEALLATAEACGVPARVVGEAGGDVVAVPGLFSVALEKVRAAHEGWLPAYMGG
jgi:phosphoribosylformylglycinamidine synthase